MRPMGSGSPMLNSELVVGVDIGSTTTCAVVSEVFQDRELIDVLGVGLVASQGVVNGVIEDVVAAGRSIREALEIAEAMADVDTRTAVVSLRGDHLASQTEIGMLDLPGGRAITQDHLDALRAQGQEISTPPGREVVHVDAGDYTLDTRRGLASPVGLTGSHLEAQLNIVTGSVLARSRIEEAMGRADVSVHQFALEGLALGIACLSEEERQLGVSLIALGGDTTTISHFRHGALAFHSVLPLGGAVISRDIGAVLSTSAAEGERLKLAYWDPEFRRDPMAEVPYRIDRTDEVCAVTVDFLGRIIDARAEEILEMARDRLMVRGCLAASPCGIILAGGSSRIPGLADLARRIYGGMPTRIAEPRRVANGLDLVRDPATHSALGLTLLAGDWMKAESHRVESMSFLDRLWQAVKDLLGLGRRPTQIAPPAAPTQAPPNDREPADRATERR